MAQKIVPGGPFISLFGDIIPAAFALAAIWCSLSYINYPLLKIKVAAAAHIVLATALLAWVTLAVACFYFNPHARGDAFGL